jgi:MFS family permease
MVAALGGLGLAWWVIMSLIATCLVLFALLYHPPKGAQAGAAVVKAARFPVYALFLASMVWALYNAALAMVFSFGPALLIQRDWSLTGAGSAISAFMVVFSIALPLGGIIGDKTGRRHAIILTSLISFAVLMPFLPFVPAWAVIVILLVVGALFSLAAGPIMTLPSQVLTPASRSFGMGVFFAIYYGVMMIGPRIVGGLAEAAQDAGLAITAAAVMSLGAIVMLELFRRRNRAIVASV